MEQITDQELVARARHGDRQAFGQLVRRYQPAARSIALRMLADEQAAGELAQEAVLQAWLGLSRLREPERFKSWLFGILINLCRGYLRRAQRDPLSLDELSEAAVRSVAQPQVEAGDPAGLAETHELDRLVLAAVQELPSTQRDSVILFYYQQLDLQEIAVQSGVSAGTVKVRLHRARRRLRALLLEAYPELDWQMAPQERSLSMVAVTILDVLQMEDRHIVVLIDQSGERLLPIWIGQYEALNIALGLSGAETPRPMTFDTLARTIDALGGRLVEARVEALKQDTFYGVARLEHAGKSIELDVRPSDLLALAVRTGCPLQVGEEVLAAAGVEMDAQQMAALQPGRWMQALLKDFEGQLRGAARQPLTTAQQQQECQRLVEKLLSGPAAN